MIRNLKALGLALAVVFAMSAVAASAASAEVFLTGTGAVEAEATDPAATFATAVGTKFVCHAIYTVGNVDETESPGIHPELVLPATELTITPHYTGCHSFGSGGSELGPATVTMNGCDFDVALITQPANTVSGRWKVTCPGSSKIEIHVYTNSTHATNICTFTVFPQEDLTGGKAVDTGNTIALSGNVPNIAMTRDNLLCGGTVNQTATLSLGGAVQGTNANGEEVNLDLTE
jgi:hypothetical protein